MNSIKVLNTLCLARVKDAHSNQENQSKRQHCAKVKGRVQCEQSTVCHVAFKTILTQGNVNRNKVVTPRFHYFTLRHFVLFCNSLLNFSELFGFTPKLFGNSSGILQ